LHEFCAKAQECGYDLAWPDTCCIKKESSSELDEAIRSMYRWYRDAYIRIVHLAQSETLETLDADEWFIRGWTPYASQDVVLRSLVDTSYAE
jgi:hypothetical protein